MKLYASDEFLTKVKVVKDPKIQEEIKKFLRHLKGHNSAIIIPELIYCGSSTYSKRIAYYFVYLSIDAERAMLIDFSQK